MRKAMVVVLESKNAVYFEKYLPLIAGVLLDNFLDSLTEKERDELLQKLSQAKRKEAKKLIEGVVRKRQHIGEHGREAREEQRELSKGDFDRIFGPILEGL